MLKVLHSIFMMFINLGTVGGQAVGGMLTESLGFSGMVLAMGLINLVNIPFVVGIFRQRMNQVHQST